MTFTVTGCSTEQAGEHSVTSPDGTLWQSMTVERLPDLNTSRGNHRAIVIGDEIVILGGHTEGFKPVETAEYYADASWHTISMLYPHQNGFAAKLQDGQIMLGGGSAEAFGIGQSFGAEIYNPKSHTFSPVGIMTKKRTLSSALTLPDGRVIIAGNWYADDSYETWSTTGGFVPGDPLSPGWSAPFILSASGDDIIVFGPFDTNGNDISGIVKHINGETDTVPLLERWKLSHNYFYFPDDYQIDDYTYLLSALNQTADQAAIIKMDNGEFSLLEMENPLPAQGPDGNPIQWGNIQVDRPAGLIWMHGFAPKTGRIYFACINYGSNSVKHYYADNPGGFPAGCARLMSGGRMLLTGGLGWNKDAYPVQVDNFKTYSSVYIFHTELSKKATVPFWAIIICILIAAGIIAIIVIKARSRVQETPLAADDSRLNLMEQISALIEEKELYRKKNLRITDVASELATNKTYVSLLLNNLSGESFTSMITRYRVMYAQKLLREQPDMMLDEVADQSGFSSRTTFFRNFKAVTGMTPQDWKNKNNKNGDA